MFHRFEAINNKQSKSQNNQNYTSIKQEYISFLNYLQINDETTFIC